ncbi:serine protease 48 [Elephas maximus indicus]|uniref:serine protease 48 n=1 Tax=Elephas maximus indicus TaxID=99487 RepID=UPI002115DF10|nr:serine protease 48 [Elephas maximus indicus]
MGPAVHAFLLSLLLGISVCGRPTYRSRIVGGQDAVEGHWPWQVSLRFGQTHICGGSLIAEKWILTAAHCLPATWTIFTYTVWLGSIHADDSSQGLQYHVSKIIIHPNFKERTADIALLKLYSRVTFTSLILPICLPTIKEHLTIPASCWVTGWGETKKTNGTDFYSTLQEAEVPVIDRQACDRLYNPVGIFLPGSEPVIKEDMICAGNTNSMKDSCKGDSGGPLSCLIDDVWIQIGLVSWGTGCGQTLPGVYASVIYYQKWINATISRAEVLRPKNLNLTNFLLPTALLPLTLLGPFRTLWA